MAGFLREDKLTEAVTAHKSQKYCRVFSRSPLGNGCEINIKFRLEIKSNDI